MRPNYWLAGVKWKTPGLASFLEAAIISIVVLGARKWDSRFPGLLPM